MIYYLKYPADAPEISRVLFQSISALLIQLWKCCLHPYLFDGVREVTLDKYGTEVRQGHR